MVVNREIDEGSLIARLHDGDESAFVVLVDRYHHAMIRVARGFVRDEATAEDVVQESWLGVLNGLAAFEGRSSLKSWIFAIVINRAKTRATREGRSTPFSSLVSLETSGREAAVAPDRFLDATAKWPGHWAQPPVAGGDDPEARLLRSETMAQLRRIVDDLPPAQRTVITLRDIAGQDAESICNALGVSETNMRVLLHRARSKVRGRLERYLADTEEAARS
ncbi:MAG: sigma-70 family RNA polymerase sigma factor [Candidatus Eremiobacteraeota bacterium]|nr:sigma-70 family RNA polymerase sigma factor [Candidatus Eremiobacteraeota bacterium]